jgi:hypothetical protein
MQFYEVRPLRDHRGVDLRIAPESSTIVEMIDESSAISSTIPARFTAHGALWVESQRDVRRQVSQIK